MMIRFTSDWPVCASRAVTFGLPAVDRLALLDASLGKVLAENTVVDEVPPEFQLHGGL